MKMRLTPEFNDVKADIWNKLGRNVRAEWRLKIFENTSSHSRLRLGCGVIPAGSWPLTFLIPLNSFFSPSFTDG
jgi:hypothetical protein